MLLNNKINKSVISINVTWGSFILMSLQNNSIQETLYFYMHVWVKDQLLSHFLGWKWDSTTKFCRWFSQPCSPSQILEISSSFAHRYLFLHHGNVVEKQDKQISRFQQCNLTKITFPCLNIFLRVKLRIFWWWRRLDISLEDIVDTFAGWHPHVDYV